jgi:hypothetical protein
MWAFAQQNAFTFLLIVFLFTWLIGCCIRMVSRSMNIMARGWPPPHLDADGDFRTESDDA